MCSWHPSVKIIAAVLDGGTWPEVHLPTRKPFDPQNSNGVDHRRCPSGRVLGPLGPLLVVRIGSSAQGINTQRNGTNHKPGFHSKFMRQKGGGGSGRPPARAMLFGGQPYSGTWCGQHHGGFTPKSHDLTLASHFMRPEGTRTIAAILTGVAPVSGRGFWPHEPYRTMANLEPESQAASQQTTTALPCAAACPGWPSARP